MSLESQKFGVRFAPSPTGDFHIGNLRTAWISQEWARALDLPLVFRFEDIDQPRVVHGARERQLEQMASLGIFPDRDYLQSSRRARHWQLFERARATGKIYPCFCSRQRIQEALAGIASAPHSEAALYDGACRKREGIPQNYSHPTIAWRFRSDADGLGMQDFILARTNFAAEENSYVPAYAWACAVDDWDGRYELIVRAADLAHALKPQRELQLWLRALERDSRRLPAVFHTALVVGAEGRRLEKRTQGATLAEYLAMGNAPGDLLRAFRNSFTVQPEDFAPEKVWAETLSSISLPMLGI